MSVGDIHYCVEDSKVAEKRLKLRISNGDKVAECVRDTTIMYLCCHFMARLGAVLRLWLGQRELNLSTWLKGRAISIAGNRWS